MCDLTVHFRLNVIQILHHITFANKLFMYYLTSVAPVIPKTLLFSPDLKYTRTQFCALQVQAENPFD